MVEQTRFAVGSQLRYDEIHDVDTPVSSTMHSGIAAHWDSWSMMLGHGAQKILEDVAEALPQVVQATIATADGLNLCSLGIKPADVGRVVAVSSSLLAVSRAFGSTVHGTPNGTLAHIANGRTHTVVVSLTEEPLGQLLVSLTGEDVDPGRLAGAALDTARRVGAWLRTS